MRKATAIRGVVPPLVPVRHVSGNALLARLNGQLEKRRVNGKLRTLPVTAGVGVDFSSNDYLGLSRNVQLQQRIEDDWHAFRRTHVCTVPPPPLLGSTGSRLLTGNSTACEDLERYLAAFHGHRHCLLANSGWDLNFGLLACLLTRDSVVLYDELSHNSLIMGTRSGRQRHHAAFRHNSVAELRELLHRHRHRRQADGGAGAAHEALVVVESIYSMDGDACPLPELLGAAEEFGAMVLVDEAHSTGVVGPRGEGSVAAHGLQGHPSLLGVVHTFGKAVGLHGAALLTAHEAVVGTVVNYHRPFVYSTSLPLASIRAVRVAYDAMAAATAERAALAHLVTVFREECNALALDALPSTSPIQGVLIPTNHAVVRAAGFVAAQGYHCLPIRAPTVPEGSERLRIILHAHNSESEVRGLCRTIKAALSLATS